MEFVKNILRIVQLIWVILLTALLGNVINENKNAAGSAEAAVNYSLFATVLAWVAALWGLASRWVGQMSIGSGLLGFLVLGLDGAAALFSLIAGIVLAAKLKAVNCGGNLSNKGSSWIGYGSDDVEKRCRELQASTAFMWFLAVSLIATFVLTLVGSSRRMGGSSGGVPSGVGSVGPMSQV